MSAPTATGRYKTDRQLTLAGPEHPIGEQFYSLRPRLVATCFNTSICLMASLRVKWTTSTQ